MVEQIANDTKGLLSEKEVAALLGLHQRTIRNYRIAGTLSFVRLGARRIGYRAEHVEEFLQNNEQRATKN